MSMRGVWRIRLEYVEVPPGIDDPPPEYGDDPPPVRLAVQAMTPDDTLHRARVAAPVLLAQKLADMYGTIVGSEPFQGSASEALAKNRPAVVLGPDGGRMN